MEREHTMRKATIIAASIVGGIAATALVASASFALATGVRDNRSVGQAMHETQSIGQSMHNDRAPGGSAHTPGNGSNPTGKGMGMERGQGSSAGMADGLTGVASGTLTSEQKTTLSSMAEEEKVAHDLYIAFGELYGDTVFDRISNAETKHLDAVQTLLERYNLTDPTAGQAVGQFSSESMQKLYDTLLAQGSVSRDGAYEAARTVEKTDITDITAAMDGLTAPDVLAVYGHLLTGSQHHLTAFGG
jgi:hypothetical protein